jgi:hypothetical protein
MYILADRSGLIRAVEIERSEICGLAGTINNVNCETVMVCLRNNGTEICEGEISKS